MQTHRTEKDLLGNREIPENALHGIHTLRAVENFPLSKRPVNKGLVHSFGAVKLACAMTNHELGKWDGYVYSAIERACREMMAGNLDGHIIVDALQGGAGTSTNMNVNEVIANHALVLLGKNPGDYEIIHPIEDINLHQSTNDTYPTALKVAAIYGLRRLEIELISLLESFQKKEKEFANVVKVGRTEMQDAVLTTMGRTMSAFAEAFGRDRWRVYKCEERLRVVNLGGTAIGTGISAPRKYIFKVVENLKTITGFGLARAENLVEATQNADVFVEVSGILKACASNLLKISGDLRLMSSGPDAGINEITLPERQAGSTIMPGKVNPVIPEAISQAAIAVISNDSSICIASSLGSLELNAFMPIIADSLLGSIDLLANACNILRNFCIEGMTANEDVCRRQVENSTAAVTALIGKIGYLKAQEIAKSAKQNAVTIKRAVIDSGVMTEQEFNQLIEPESVTRLGE